MAGKTEVIRFIEILIKITTMKTELRHRHLSAAMIRYKNSLLSFIERI